MPRPAERRAQGVAEWIAVIAAVAAAIAIGGVAAVRMASQVAERLAPRASDRMAGEALAAAAAGAPNAVGLLGAEAWLAEEHGPAQARRLIADAVVTELLRAHPRWGDDVHVPGASRGGSAPKATLQSIARTQVRIVTAADERAAGAGPDARERTAAGAASLAWSGIGELAQRIARPLGLAVGMVRALLSARTGEPMQAPGTRAGDAIVCRPASAVITGRLTPAGRRISGLWRVGVLRDGRIILDEVRGGPSPCRLPADD